MLPYRDLPWEEGFQRISTYLREEGDGIISRNCEMLDGFPIGRWAALQRRKHRLAVQRNLAWRGTLVLAIAA
jgi:hypothetical protein